jgi:tetratricopeptide (TPR) repeat protein
VRQATRSLAAHDLYLQGRSFWNQRTPSALRTAVRYFERAIREDSNYAAAYAGLADAYVLFPFFSISAPREAYPKAKAAALRALALDRTLAEAHAALAHGKMRYDWDWSGAEREFRRALALDPGDATAHMFYSEYLSRRGRPVEALVEIDRALALDPLSRVISVVKGELLDWSRRYDEAIAQLRQALELDPDFAFTRSWLGVTYLAKGMRAEAVADLETAVRLGDRSYDVGLLAHAYAVSGQRDRALAMVRELTERVRHEYVAPIAFALAYTGLGDMDEAFASLERAADARDPRLVTYLLDDPLFDTLRSDPRFTALVEKIGLK